MQKCKWGESSRVKGGWGGVMFCPLQLLRSVGMNLNRRGVKGGEGAGFRDAHEREGVGGRWRESGLLALEALQRSWGGDPGPEPQCHIPLSG